MLISYRFALPSLLILFQLSVWAQPSSSQRGYRDFVFLHKDTICLLTTAGELLVAPISSSTATSSIPVNMVVNVMALDRQGNLFVCDKNNQVKKLDRRTQQWTALPTFLGKLYGFVFDSQNNSYLIINRGIISANKRTLYFPDSTKFLNTQPLNKDAWASRVTFWIDKHDKIWIGLDYGEWGGDVFCFDTREQAFLPLQVEASRIDGNPVSGFCEDQNHIYLSSGLVHFFTHGRIFKFTQGKAQLLLEAEDRQTPVTAMRTNPKTGKKIKETYITFRGGEYIGPVAYNPINNCLYFYSQHGIHKGDLSKNLSIIKNWQKILEPKLQWTSGRPDALGPAMNVSKMQFDSSGTLFFLTDHDGLGIYDGKQVRFIK